MRFIRFSLITLLLCQLVHGATVTEVEQRPSVSHSPAVTNSIQRIARILAVTEPIVCCRYGYSPYPTLSSTSSYNPTSYTQTHVHQKVNYTNFLEQFIPVLTTQHAHVQMRNLTDIDARTYQALSCYNVQKWLDHFKAQAQHNAQKQSPHADHHQIYAQQHKTPYEIFQRFGLYPLKEYRKALEASPEHDVSMIYLAHEIKMIPGLREEVQKAAEQAFALQKERYSLVGTVIHGFKNILRIPSKFDIVAYIEARAQIARDRAYALWVEESKQSLAQQYTPATLANLQKDCSQRISRLTEIIRHTSDPNAKQVYQELLTFLQTTHAALPASCSRFPALTEYHLPISSAAYVAHIPERVDGVVSFAQSQKTDPHHNQCFGNQVQMGIFKQVTQLIEKAHALNRNAIEGHINHEIVEHLITNTLHYTELARLYNNASDFALALTTLQEAIGSYAHAQAVVHGTYNSEKLFSPHVITQLERHVGQQNGTRFKELARALESIKTGSQRIFIIEHILNPSTIKLLEQQTIPAILFTRCAGNKYQHVRHTHMVALLNKVAEVHNANPANPLVAETTKAILHLAVKAEQASSLGAIERATQLDTAAHALYDMASHFVRGALDGAKQVVHDIAYLATHLDTVAHAIIKVTVQVANIMDTFSGDKMVMTPQREQEMIHATEPMRQAIEHLGEQLELIMQMSLPEMGNAVAYHAGSFSAQAIMCDGLFSALSGTVQLAKTGGERIAHFATTAASKALDASSKTLSSAMTKLDAAMTKAELHVLGTMHLEKQAAQAAGVDVNTPLMYFNEKMVEKHGTEKVAAAAREVAARNQLAHSFLNVIQKHLGNIKEISNTKVKDILHILDRHIPGGKDVALREGTSLFTKSGSPLEQAEEILQYCSQAWKRGNITEQGAEKIIKVHDCGKIIGLDKSGNPTSKIQIVVVPPLSRIITAFPVH